MFGDFVVFVLHGLYDRFLFCFMLFYAVFVCFCDGFDKIEIENK
jgi:hypothetical protein